MTERPTVMSVFGTRPEAVKLAPIIRRLEERRAAVKSIVVVTGQHRQMLDQVLHLFDIRPDHDLNLMREGQSPFEVTAGALTGLRPILEAERPNIVLVQGDTTTVLAAALAAYYLKIPVGHVEAGLRTNDKFRPFPEEMNRRLTSAIADLHFAPTEGARENLRRENIRAEHIFVTGNTVIDALHSVASRPYTFEHPLKRIRFDSARVILVTAHRRENWGPPMASICRALRLIAAALPDVEIVFSVHKNPIVRQTVDAELSGLERVHLIEPLDYEPFTHVMKRSYLILTDSGGIQEEATSLGKPVLVLRDVTERPEGIASGNLRLVGTDTQHIVDEATRLLTDHTAYDTMAHASNPYGDGHAAERIVDIVEQWLRA